MAGQDKQGEVGEAIERLRTEAKKELGDRRQGVQRRRARRFLTVQAGLLVVAWLGVLATVGSMSPLLIIESVASMGVMTLVTVVAWLAFRRNPEDGVRLVTGLLYIDALVPTFFFYAGGEFESPTLGLVVLPVIMAPMFTAKRHAWGIAGTTSALYLLLVGARFFDVIPYGWMVPIHQEAMVQNSTYLSDTVAGFLILIFGIAWLAGEASIDILTSQKELEEEVDRQTRRLARTNGELQDRNRALDEFNAALSHDLKSPLQTALLAAEAMIYGSPRLTPGQMELAETIAQSTSRMGDLTRELLRLSRMSDELEEWEDVEIEGLVEQVVADLGGRIRSAGARIRIEDPLPVAMGNASLLREALQNLIENGIKYGAVDRPEVLIRNAQAPWGRVAFAVEDNGLGISEDQRDLVFRPFLKLKEARNTEGVGAGLAIVQRIVSVHGGSVKVEDGSSLGGARFVVLLPRPGTLDTLGL